jgi:hypothetical protein
LDIEWHDNFVVLYGCTSLCADRRHAKMRCTSRQQEHNAWRRRIGTVAIGGATGATVQPYRPLFGLFRIETSTSIMEHRWRSL